MIAIRPARSLSTWAYRWLTAGVLLLAYGWMLSSSTDKSATVDEQSHLFRGVAYLKTGATHFLLGHPLFASVLSAAPLLTEPTLRLPLADPAWAAGDWSLAGDAFLWQLNDRPLRLVWLGRWPVMLATLLLGALTAQWGRRLAGRPAGVLAAALLLWNPNLLAHGALVTGDAVVTLFYTATLYAVWRWVGIGGWRWVLAAGAALGLAAASKFNAGVLVPILALLLGWRAWRMRTWRPLLGLVVMGVVAWGTVWLVYGLAWRPLPGGAFWDDLLWELAYFDKPHGAYLAGEFSAEGWWYYFPLAWWWKTPLPLHVVVLAAVVVAGRDGRRGRPGRDWAFVILPPALYFAFSLTSSLTIGYRYLLPVWPGVAVFCAGVFMRPGRPAIWRGLTMLGVAWLALEAATAWPDYIPYFQNLARSSGWRLLSDSNVDWGQDLPALAAWQATTGEAVYLSYFGSAHPSAYGVQFQALPTWPPAPEQTPPDRQPFYPPDPAPGWYALSVTNWHGTALGEQRDIFAWFRTATPAARLGGSLLLYQVAAHGAPVAVAFSGTTPADLPPAWHDALGTNAVHVHWFDARHSAIFPAMGGWWVTAADQPPDPALLAWGRATEVARTPALVLYRVPPAASTVAPLATLGTGELALLQVQPLPAAPGEAALLTAWQVLQPTGRPRHIFIHLLGDIDTPLAQWDGWDVDTQTWQAGDLVVQVHRLPWPAGVQRLGLGVYDPQTLARLTTETPYDVLPFAWPLE